jgi:chemotaxis protein MotB
MQENGVRADQVSQVRGYADRRLRIQNDPEAASNRRISMIVQYQTKLPGEKPDEPASAGAHEEKPAETAAHH